MMMMTECPTPKQLQEFALGQLSNDQSDVLFEHVETCDHCRAALETVEDSQDSLVAALLEPDALRSFEAEPDCRLAVAKALDAQALLDTAGDNLGNLPSSIGEYDIVRPLGKGGMGSVYLARHNKLGREVALKVLATHRLADARMRRRFEAEMRAVGRLNHPNVVTAHDAREVDGTAVLVTEFINGLDLEQLVHRVGPLSISEACEIARQVALALEYISEQGFVHRDVKPSNIMLSEAGEVKLLDLGLARFQYGDNDHSEITAAGQVMGTADYVAPEQVSDCRQADVRSDIYSLGCTLYKLLTGNPPFTGPRYTNAFAKLTAHVSDSPRSLSIVLPQAPLALVQLVDSMLAKSPEQRPQSPEAIAEKLAAFSAGANLKELADRGKSLPPKPAGPSQKAASNSKSNLPPLLRRNVPMSIAIAMGLLGFLGGLFLGIIIKITNPDGSQTEIRPAPQSRVEISDDGKSTPGLKTETPSQEGQNLGDLVKQLQGTWRVDATDQGAEDSKKVDEITLMAFDKDEFYLVEKAELAEAGTFSVQAGLGDGSNDIDFQDQFQQGSIKRGLFRILPDGKLELCWNADSPRERPAYFSPRERPFKLGHNARAPVQIILERIANDVREIPLKGRELYDPNNRSLLMALAQIQQAIQFGPTNFAQQVKKVQGAAKTSRTKNNLKQIAIAFYSYQDTYRHFPGTANTRLSKGKQTYPYSWRVAILPFIEHNELYEAYRFEEPWDSEHNLTLLDKMPAIYRSPFASAKQKPGECNYQGFAGEQTALGTGDGVPLREFTDGTSNTLLIMDTSGSVPWTKPADLPFPGNYRGNLFFPGVDSLNYATVDGAMHSLGNNELDQLTKLITRNGGEPRGNAVKGPAVPENPNRSVPSKTPKIPN